MFKKKEKTEKAPNNKKVRTMKVGTHKKSVLLLWAVLLASTSFGVYKNFTAIDTHTVHEKEIIQLRLNDTNGIENFRQRTLRKPTTHGIPARKPLKQGQQKSVNTLPKNYRT